MKLSTGSAKFMFRQLVVLNLIALAVIVAGCALTPPPSPPQEDLGVEVSAPPEECGRPPGDDLQEAEQEQALDGQPGEEGGDLHAKRDRALCYKLQPSQPTQGQNQKKAAKTVSRCQPQSLIYARCRSAVMTCRLGDTSPLQWFSCAQKNGNTQKLPASGSIMVLDGNARRKMSTGHPLYVENARKNSNDTWLLRVSHTNYDRQCHLDQDAEVIYDPAKMTASFQSGPWSGWACDLKVLGFIVR